MAVVLDANAVLRYVLEDVQDQADEVAAAVMRGAEVTVEVIAECVYVLEGVYQVPRSLIAESLGLLLDEVDCRRKRVAATALGFYRASSFDFVDCVLAAAKEVEGAEVLTFDKKLRRLLEQVGE